MIVFVVLLVVLPLANLPTIRLLAKLNTVGVFSFCMILLFSYTSAGVAGIDEAAFHSDQLAHPESAGVVFGIFSLSFFVHNALLTIMRGSAKPEKGQRDLGWAFFLTWACYASMGVSANICPPMRAILGPDKALEALGSPQARNIFLGLEQPASST
jgi:sodium-coupled neutral amino acid transporter 9